MCLRSSERFFMGPVSSVTQNVLDRDRRLGRHAAARRHRDLDRTDGQGVQDSPGEPDLLSHMEHNHRPTATATNTSSVGKQPWCDDAPTATHPRGRPHPANPGRTRPQRRAMSPTEQASTVLTAHSRLPVNSHQPWADACRSQRGRLHREQAHSARDQIRSVTKEAPGWRPVTGPSARFPARSARRSRRTPHRQNRARPRAGARRCSMKS